MLANKSPVPPTTLFLIFDTDFLNYYSKKLRIDVDIVDKSNAFIDYGTENSLKKLNSIIN